MESDVPERWERRKVRDVCEVINGQSPKSSRCNEEARGMPFFQGNAEFGSLHPSPVQWTEKPKKTAAEGDILFSVRAPVGDLNIARKKCSIGRGLCALRANANVDARFLFYKLSGSSRRLDGLSQGSTFQAITATHLRNFRLTLPSLPEQKKIAAILSTVDEVIEATETVIEQTRRVKKGLLEELLGRGIGHEEFKETRIGEIPAQWDVKRLDAVISEGFQNGLSPTSVERNTGLQTFSIAALRGGIVDPDGHSRFVDLPEDEASKYRIESGQILIVRGNGNPELVGRSGIVTKDLDGDYIFPDILIRVRPGEEVESVFLNAVLNSRALRRQIRGRAKTTNGTHKINQSDLSSLKIPVPPLSEQRRFVDVLKRFGERTKVAQDRLRQLKKLKKGLLQDLLTGEVRVTDVDVTEIEEQVDHQAGEPVPAQ